MIVDTMILRNVDFDLIWAFLNARTQFRQKRVFCCRLEYHEESDDEATVDVYKKNILEN